MSEANNELEPFADALAALFRRAVRRSRKEFSKAAETSRKRLEQRQKRRDLEHFWIRLGKTSQRLVEAGEIDHPALRKAMARIAELEAELDAEAHLSEADEGGAEAS